MSDLNNNSNIEDYGDNSIDSLEGAERVRTRPASVLGSNGIAGARHGVTELVGNALDEATAGFGNRLILMYYKDGSISIRDFGRGVPMGYNENNKVMNWFLVFNEMYAGGKYQDYQEELRKIKDWSKFNPRDYNYLYSIGLNGLGAASTQYASSFFKVESYRNGKVTKMEFRRGYPVLTIDGEEFHATPSNLRSYLNENPNFDIRNYEPTVEDTDEDNGTFIHWKPDETVFTDVDLTFEWVKGRAEAVAYVSGLSVTLIDEASDTTIEYDSGTITDLVLDIHKGKLVSKENPVVYSEKTLTHGTTDQNKIYVCEAELSFVRTEKNGSTHCFHNSIKMSNGAQYKGVDNAIYSFFQEISNEQGVSITSQDFNGKLGVVVSSYSNIADYRGQTKDEVEDLFIFRTVNDMLYVLLRTEYHKGNTDLKELVDEVVNEAKIRIEMQRQSKALRDLSKASRTRKLPEKFIPSKNFLDKKFYNSELWIVEGESAKGSVKSARFPEFQAIYAVRGKMTNALKASIEAILGSKDNRKDSNGKKKEGSKEIKEIFALAGTGIEIEGIEDESFNIEDSRFDKFVIATDADEDGAQIRVLIFCMFWKLAPEIIRRGMLYIAESPKYGITLSDGTRLYAVTDEHLDELSKEYKGQITHTERYKGLGQVNHDILTHTTMDPETRVMTQIQLEPSDYELNTVIETIFGKDPMKKRKETIMQLLGSDVIDMFDEQSELLNLIESAEEDLELEELTYI